MNWLGVYVTLSGWDGSFTTGYFTAFYQVAVTRCCCFMHLDSERHCESISVLPKNKHSKPLQASNSLSLDQESQFSDLHTAIASEI